MKYNIIKNFFNIESADKYKMLCKSDNTCNICNEIIIDELLIEITFDSIHPNTYEHIIHEHIKCFFNKHLNLEKELDQIKKDFTEYRTDINNYNKSLIELQQMKLLQSYANDYGKTILNFIDDAVKYYILNIFPNIRFNSERSFQEYIIENICRVDKDLEFINSEYLVNNKQIDILAKRGNNNVIMEIKLKATHTALSQILQYIGLYRKIHPDNYTISGIIIALEIDRDLITTLQYYNNTRTNYGANIQLFQFDIKTRQFIEKTNEHF